MKAFFLAAFVAGACIASAANTALGADNAELQGEWVATSGAINGKPYPAEWLKRTRFTFKGDALLTRGEEDRTDEGTYKADSKKSPKHLDIKIKNKTLHGIYEVKGDELKVCLEGGGKAENRPTRF